MNDPFNPYAAPQESAEPEATGRMVPAGRGARFLNFIIDYAAQVAISVVFSVGVLIIFGEDAVDALMEVPDIVIGVGLLLVYYVFLEATTSRTLGKMLTGTKVVNEEGGPPTFGQVVGRSFARLIPFEAFSFLGMPCRGWHDSLAKTYVVKSR